MGGTPRKDEKAFVEEHLLLKRIAMSGGEETF